ncbi:MAG: YceD family protein [Capsulimonadaceae bacterium]
MLRLDLSEIIRTPGMRQVYDIAEQPYTDDDVEYVAPLGARLAITNTGSMLLVRGPFHSVIGLECSRCLVPVRVPIDVDIEEEFDIRVVEDARHHDKVMEVVEDEIGRVFDGKVLQLDVLFRQAALLAAPLQPLCRTTCPGIPIKPSGEDIRNEGFRNSPLKELAHYFDDGVDKP